MPLADGNRGERGPSQLPAIYTKRYKTQRAFKTLPSISFVVSSVVQPTWTHTEDLWMDTDAHPPCLALIFEEVPLRGRVSSHSWKILNSASPLTVWDMKSHHATFRRTTTLCHDASVLFSVAFSFCVFSRPSSTFLVSHVSNLVFRLVRSFQQPGHCQGLGNPQGTSGSPGHVHCIRAQLQGSQVAHQMHRKSAPLQAFT